MPRITPPAPADMTPRQREVHDAIASGPRGRVEGPLAVWLRRPELAQKAQELALARKGGKGWMSDGSQGQNTNLRGNQSAKTQNSSSHKLAIGSCFCSAGPQISDLL